MDDESLRACRYADALLRVAGPLARLRIEQGWLKRGEVDALLEIATIGDLWAENEYSLPEIARLLGL